MYQLTETEYNYLQGVIGKQVAYYKTNYPHQLDEIWSLGNYAIGKACNLYDSGNTSAKFTTYATSAIINELKHWHRKEKRTLAYAYLDNTLTENENANTLHDLLADNTIDEYNQVDLRIIIDNALSKLTPRCQTVVRMTMEGYRQTQIAEHLEVSQCEISRILSRAYAKLKVELKDVQICLR